MELLSIYILNLVVVFGMFTVTIYRAWMEKQNLEARRKLEQLRLVLARETDAIKGLSGEEFIEMLKTILSEK